MPVGVRRCGRPRKLSVTGDHSCREGEVDEFGAIAMLPVDLYSDVAGGD